LNDISYCFDGYNLNFGGFQVIDENNLGANRTVVPVGGHCLVLEETDETEYVATLSNLRSHHHLLVR
jgi:hypothetical protein